MSEPKPAPKFKRRIKLIKPSLQLKLVAMFAGVSATSLLLQYMLFAARFSEVASTLPDGGEQILSVLPGILMQVLAMSCAYLLPVMLSVGILATFRIAGPVYRFEQYLKQVARGEVTEPCRIRDGDELWDLCDLINAATAPLRHKTAGVEAQASASATTVPVPLEEPAAPLASAR